MNALIIAERDGLPVFKNGTSVAEIAQAIGPASFDEINDCLSDLFLGLRSKTYANKEEQERVAKIYNRAIHGYPYSAIREAVDRFIAHEVKRRKEDVEFVPSAGALAKEIKHLMLINVRWEERVADAPAKLITPDKMEQLQQAFKGCLQLGEVPENNKLKSS